jgi:hypothetical protein
MSEFATPEDYARMEREGVIPHVAPAPIDWPARFRAAADVAEMRAGRRTAAYYGLNDLAKWCVTQPPDVVEAIGRALLSETS